jgi:hypothetical protein
MRSRFNSKNRIVGLRIVRGEELSPFWKCTFPHKGNYEPFERLEYQTDDGAWHKVRTQWVGRHEQYDPENRGQKS